MMEYLEFSFMPFGRSQCVNCLDNLLKILDKNHLVIDFQCIRNYIASDIINGLHYMYTNGIVQQDLSRVIYWYLMNIISIMNVALS